MRGGRFVFCFMANVSRGLGMWVHACWEARGLKTKKAHAKPWSAAGEHPMFARGFA